MKTTEVNGNNSLHMLLLILKYIPWKINCGCVIYIWTIYVILVMINIVFLKYYDLLGFNTSKQFKIVAKKDGNVIKGPHNSEITQKCNTTVW